MQHECCYTYPDAMSCPAEAVFEIRENTRQDPDNYTWSCAEHLGKMLGTTEGFPKCKSWTVTTDLSA
jgi:hypothetical protein